MKPEEIVAQAKAAGVLLYLEDEKLATLGNIPANWINLTTAWLPYRQDVIDWLKNPPWEHRVACAKARVEQTRRRNKPCIYLGDLVNPKPLCGCGPLHTCMKHTNCVLWGSNNQWVACSRCLDYQVGE